MKMTKISTLLALSILMPQLAQAAPVQSIFASRAEGKDGQPLVTITLWPGYGANLNLIPTGEIIKKAWLDAPSLVAIDFDECFSRSGEGQVITAGDNCRTTVIHLRQVTGGTFPGQTSSENATTLLTLIAEGSQGKKLYQFQVEIGKGIPQYNTLTIYPDAPETPYIDVGLRKATVEDISKGLSLAESKKFISRRDAAWGRVQNFLAQVRSGESVGNSLQRSGTNMAILTKLAELSFADAEQQNAPAPKEEATKSDLFSRAPVAPRSQPDTPSIPPKPQAQPPAKESIPAPKSSLTDPNAKVAPEPSSPESSAPLTKAVVGSPTEILARFKIPLKEGGSIRADKLLAIQQRIWWWKKGTYRRKLGTFFSILVTSKETDPDRSFEQAIQKSGLSLNDVRYFAKASQAGIEDPVSDSLRSSPKKNEQSSASPLPEEPQSSPAANAPLGRGSTRAILSRYQLPTQGGDYITADKLLDIEQSIWLWKRSIYRQKLGAFITALVTSKEKDPGRSLEAAVQQSGLSLNDVQFLMKTAQTATAEKEVKTETTPALAKLSANRVDNAVTAYSEASKQLAKLPTGGTIDTLFKLRIPLEGGGSVGAEQLLMAQERIWNWEGGTVRKKLARFIATLTASAPQGNDQALEAAIRESGLSLNKVQALLNFSNGPKKREFGISTLRNSRPVYG
jgi:hypothetical protein